MKRIPINKISRRGKYRLPQCSKLIQELRQLCGNKSELSGKQGDWQSSYQVEPHHINGRIGDRLLDPFNIIMLTRDEHNAQDNNNYDDKQDLLAFIEPVRLRQGFIKGD